MGVFEQLFTRADGLLSLIVTDADGVVLLTESSPSSKESFDTSFASTYSLVSEQANKLKLGNNKSIVVFYDQHVVVQYASNQKRPAKATTNNNAQSSGIVITMIAHNNANTQLLLDLCPSICEAISNQ